MKFYEDKMDYRLRQAVCEVIKGETDKMQTQFGNAILRNGCLTTDEFVQKHEAYLSAAKRNKKEAEKMWKHIGHGNMSKLDMMYTLLTGLKPNEAKTERRKVQSFKRTYIPLRRGA